MPPSPRVPKWAVWTLVLASFIGFADTAYLSAKALLGETPTCVLFSGCDTVTTSVYSKIGPVPVALLGFAFYFLVLVLMIAYLDRRARSLITIIRIISIPAFLFTLYLVYLQVFVLDALCVYCMGSALTSTVIAVVSQLAMRTQEISAVSAP